jgi:hypothetical protein
MELIMPCDTWRAAPQQTLTERKKSITETIQDLARRIARGDVKAIVGPQGAIAFEGWTNKNGVTDACAMRRIMASGSMAARMAIMKAEQKAGRTVDRKALAQGIHSHDGGRTWHGKG